MRLFHWFHSDPSAPSSHAWPVRECKVEALGTFFLVLTICLASLQSENFPGGPLFGPLAIGVILGVMVYVGGGISGGHYNPAVTLGAYFRGDVSSGRAVAYMIAQVVGAILAALVFYGIAGNAFLLAPTADYALSAVVLELLFTFALVYTVLSVTSKKSAGNSSYGLAIGGVLMVGVVVAGPISGGAFNPAVALGTILVDTTNLGTNVGNIFLYLLPQFVGGLLAAMTYGFTHEKE